MLMICNILKIMEWMLILMNISGLYSNQPYDIINYGGILIMMDMM